MDKQNSPTDFRIVSKPAYIEFECPHCHEQVTIIWDDLPFVPEYWGDDWHEVGCPECEKPVKLGDYEYD